MLSGCYFFLVKTVFWFWLSLYYLVYLYLCIYVFIYKNDNDDFVVFNSQEFKDYFFKTIYNFYILGNDRPLNSVPEESGNISFKTKTKLH